MTSQQSPNQKVQNNLYTNQEPNKTTVRNATAADKANVNNNASKDSNYAADNVQRSGNTRPGTDSAENHAIPQGDTPTFANAQDTDAVRSPVTAPEDESRESQSSALDKNRLGASTSEAQLEDIDEIGNAAK